MRLLQPLLARTNASAAAPVALIPTRASPLTERPPPAVGHRRRGLLPSAGSQRRRRRRCCHACASAIAGG